MGVWGWSLEWGGGWEVLWLVGWGGGRERRKVVSR